MLGVVVEQEGMRMVRHWLPAGCVPLDMSTAENSAFLPVTHTTVVFSLAKSRCVF
jgi:hypothetical protein